MSQDGHRVDRAPDGRVALDKLAGATYDLVVSDIRTKESLGKPFDADEVRRVVQRAAGAGTARGR